MNEMTFRIADVQSGRRRVPGDGYTSDGDVSKQLTTVRMVNVLVPDQYLEFSSANERDTQQYSVGQIVKVTFSVGGG